MPEIPAMQETREQAAPAGMAVILVFILGVLEMVFTIPYREPEVIEVPEAAAPIVMVLREVRETLEQMETLEYVRAHSTTTGPQVMAATLGLLEMVVPEVL
jgi:hypothetical protein